MSSATERFWAKVEFIPFHECWEWTAQTWNGYGRIRISGKNTQAHRFAYELLCGPIPEGLTIDHLCRNKSCVNPAHLEPCSLAENILRSDGLAAQNARKTHCIHGHPLSGDNLCVLTTRNERVCRTCNRESQRRRYWRRGSPQEGK